MLTPEESRKPSKSDREYPSKYKKDPHTHNDNASHRVCEFFNFPHSTDEHSPVVVVLVMSSSALYVCSWWSGFHRQGGGVHVACTEEQLAPV